MCQRLYSLPTAEIEMRRRPPKLRRVRERLRYRVHLRP